MISPNYGYRGREMGGLRIKLGSGELPFVIFVSKYHMTIRELSFFYRNGPGRLRRYTRFRGKINAAQKGLKENNMKVLPSEKEKAIKEAINEFDTNCSFTICEPCDCGSHIQHNNGGNYHCYISLAREKDRFFVKYETTSELEPEAEWEEIFNREQAIKIIEENADWLPQPHEVGTRKILINAQYGGFSLPRNILRKFGYTDSHLVQRDDENLIKYIEENEIKTNVTCSLKIVQIPSNIDWKIEQNDGLEWVAEKHRIWE